MAYANGEVPPRPDPRKERSTNRDTTVWLLLPNSGGFCTSRRPELVLQSRSNLKPLALRLIAKPHVALFSSYLKSLCRGNSSPR